MAVAVLRIYLPPNIFQILIEYRLAAENKRPCYNKNLPKNVIFVLQCRKFRKFPVCFSPKQIKYQHYTNTRLLSWSQTLNLWFNTATRERKMTYVAKFCFSSGSTVVWRGRLSMREHEAQMVGYKAPTTVTEMCHYVFYFWLHVVHPHTKKERKKNQFLD